MILGSRHLRVPACPRQRQRGGSPIERAAPCSWSADARGRFVCDGDQLDAVDEVALLMAEHVQGHLAGDQANVQFVFIVCVATAPIPGRPRATLGTGIGIAGFPSGVIFSRRSKSLWMMFRP